MAEIRLLIESGRHVPGSKVMVDEEVFIQALDGIRSSYVSELELARHTTRHQQELLAEAHAEAERLLGEARRSAEVMLTDVGVRFAAEERAEDILASAGHTASRTEESASKYALDVLSQLDTDLRPVEEALAEARRNLGLPEW
jgi:hypothetical protein